MSKLREIINLGIDSLVVGIGDEPLVRLYRATQNATSLPTAKTAAIEVKSYLEKNPSRDDDSYEGKKELYAYMKAVLTVIDASLPEDTDISGFLTRKYHEEILKVHKDGIPAPAAFKPRVAEEEDKKQARKDSIRPIRISHRKFGAYSDDSEDDKFTKGDEVITINHSSSDESDLAGEDSKFIRRESSARMHRAAVDTIAVTVSSDVRNTCFTFKTEEQCSAAQELLQTDRILKAKLAWGDSNSFSIPSHQQETIQAIKEYGRRNGWDVKEKKVPPVPSGPPPPNMTLPKGGAFHTKFRRDYSSSDSEEEEGAKPIRKGGSQSRKTLKSGSNTSAITQHHATYNSDSDEELTTAGEKKSIASLTIAARSEEREGERQVSKHVIPLPLFSDAKDSRLSAVADNKKDTAFGASSGYLFQPTYIPTVVSNASSQSKAVGLINQKYPIDQAADAIKAAAKSWMVEIKRKTKYSLAEGRTKGINDALKEVSSDGKSVTEGNISAALQILGVGDFKKITEGAIKHLHTPQQFVRK